MPLLPIVVPTSSTPAPVTLGCFSCPFPWPCFEPFVKVAPISMFSLSEEVAPREVKPRPSRPRESFSSFVKRCGCSVSNQAASRASVAGDAGSNILSKSPIVCRQREGRRRMSNAGAYPATQQWHSLNVPCSSTSSCPPHGQFSNEQEEPLQSRFLLRKNCFDGKRLRVRKKPPTLG